MARPKKSIDVTKTCINCEQEFTIPAWEARRRERKYCSPKCRTDHLTSFVDKDFFAEPNADMAYVLGLAMTDGHIGLRKSGREFLSIKSIDRDVLDKVKALMKSDYGIYDCGESDAGNTVWRIDVANDKIVADVKRWGIHPRKTFTTEFPSDLPEKYHADFIRGLFDGDGGVYLYRDERCANGWVKQFMILGTKALLTPIPESMGIEATITPSRKIHKLQFYASDKFLKAYKFLYYDQIVPCIARKKKAFEELLANSFDRKRSAENRKRRKLEKLAALGQLPLGAAVPVEIEVKEEALT